MARARPGSVTRLDNHLTSEIRLDAPCVKEVQSREPAWRQLPKLPILNTLGDIVSSRTRLDDNLSSEIPLGKLALNKRGS